MRFKVVTAEEIVEHGWDPDEDWVWDPEEADLDFKGYLLDTKTNEIVFADGGETEDMTLGRNLGGLVRVLNRVADGG